MFYKKITLFLTIFAVLIFGSLTVNGEEAENQGIDGITKPVSDIELSFVQPGKVQQVTVREGDMVHIGDILMQQDDEIEQIQLRILKSRSENSGPINLAAIDLKQKEKDLQKIKQARDKGAITQWEVDHASLAVDTALLTLKIREFERNQDKMKVESIRESINRLTLTSPIDGSVEEIKIEPGESVQALSPIIRIVKKDPLIIDLPVQIDLAKTLKNGEAAQVKFEDGEELVGEILKISTVADAAATTLDVKIELANPAERPAGERVSVLFSASQ